MGRFLTVALSPSSLSTPRVFFMPYPISTLLPLPLCLCVLPRALLAPLPFAPPTPAVRPSCPCPFPFLLPLFAPEICTMSLEGNHWGRGHVIWLMSPHPVQTQGRWVSLRMGPMFTGTRSHVHACAQAHEERRPGTQLLVFAIVSSR